MTETEILWKIWHFQAMLPKWLQSMFCARVEFSMRSVHTLSNILFYNKIKYNG